MGLPLSSDRLAPIDVCQRVTESGYVTRKDAQSHSLQAEQNAVTVHLIAAINFMGILRPRTRMVYCRLSEEEFTQISDAYVHLGLRNLSDFMRMAMQRALACLGSSDAPSPIGEVQGRLADIENNLATIMARLEWIMRSAKREDTTAG